MQLTGLLNLSDSFTKQTPHLEVILFIAFVKSLRELFALSPLVIRVIQVMELGKEGGGGSLFWTDVEVCTKCLQEN